MKIQSSGDVHSKSKNKCLNWVVALHIIGWADGKYWCSYMCFGQGYTANPIGGKEGL